LFLSNCEGGFEELGVEAGDDSAEDPREIWWTTCSKNESVCELLGVVQGSFERGDFTKREGVFRVLGVAEKRGVSVGRSPVEFRRAMRSPKEWSSPCDVVRIVSRYVSSVLACLLCIFPGVLGRLGTAEKTSVDLRRALCSDECSKPPCEGIMPLQLTGLLVPKLRSSDEFFFVQSQDLFQIADKEVRSKQQSFHNVSVSM
jgi:hypothetical protein